jgi:hypothetical protein
MIIRKNDLAGNVLILNEGTPYISTKDFRKEQADRLLAHGTKKFIYAGGLLMKGKARYFFLSTSARNTK